LQIDRDISAKYFKGKSTPEEKFGEKSVIIGEQVLFCLLWKFVIEQFLGLFAIMCFRQCFHLLLQPASLVTQKAGSAGYPLSLI